MEFWKNVRGYEGLYKVSTEGRVKNARSGRVLRPAKNGSGYFRVLLSRDGKKTNHSVHRLVAIAFVPTNNEALEVNHVNGVKTDNRAENLEWVTHAENCRHIAEQNALHGVEVRRLVADALAEAMMEEEERIRAMEAKLEAIERRAEALGVTL